MTSVYTDYNGEIKGAGEWKQSDGNTYLYWATNTSIARVIMNGQIDTPWVAGVVTMDYKTTLDAADYHPMRIAAGNLNIGNGGFLATIEYDGTFNPAAMNLRPGNVIKCLEERDDYVIIGSERVDEAEEGHLWSWITTALNWIQKKKIPVKGVNSLIDTELLLMQGGAQGEIFYSDFNNTAPLNSIPDGAGKVNSDGTAIYNDLAIFGMYGTIDTTQTGIYSYGRRSQRRPMALNQEFRLTRTTAGSSVAEIGSVWVASSAVFASWKTQGLDEVFEATEYGIDMSSTTTRASARYEGLEFTGEYPHLKKHFKSLKTVMEKLPSGTSFSILYKTDRTSAGGDESAGAGWKYANVAGGLTTTYSTTDSTEAEFIINDTGKTFEVAVEMNPSGSSTPEITALVGYFEEETLEY